MSLETITFNFLSLKPNIIELEDRIQAKSSFLQKLFYLFSCDRAVTFHREKRIIEIFRKSWWLKKTTDYVSYGDVNNVTFGFENWHDFGFDFWQDKYERIWVSLELKESGEIKPLVCFEGEGAKETGVLGTLLGDSMLDFRGNQGSAASEFYNTIKDELKLWPSQSE